MLSQRGCKGGGRRGQRSRFRAACRPSAGACSYAPPASEFYEQLKRKKSIFSWLEFQGKACYFLEILCSGDTCSGDTGCVWRQEAAGFDAGVCLRSAPRWCNSLGRVFIHFRQKDFFCQRMKCFLFMLWLKHNYCLFRAKRLSQKY